MSVGFFEVSAVFSPGLTRGWQLAVMAGNTIQHNKSKQFFIAFFFY
jgi:hypothetical protein